MTYVSVEEIALLEYVYDQVSRDSRQRVDIPRGLAGVTDPYQLVSRMQQLELLAPASLAGDVHITQSGIAVVDDLRERRRDRAARLGELRLGLAKWLYDDYTGSAAGPPPIDTAEFARQGDSHYLGERFSDTEIARAAAFLFESGLIVGAVADQTDHVAHPRLTRRGVACVESGQSVSEFLKPQFGGSVYHVHVDRSQGVVIGNQSGVTQHNSGPHLDKELLAQLASFAGFVRHSLPFSVLDDQQQAVAVELSQELEAEVSSGTADRGRFRKLLDGILVALAPAAGTAIGQAVVPLGEELVKTLSHS